MRNYAIMAATLTLVLGACKKEFDLEQPICTIANAADVSDSAETSFGDSASSVVSDVSLIEGAALIDVDGGSFNDIFRWTFEPGGQARTMDLDGSSGIGASCPIGTVLEVPVLVSLESDRGLDMSGTGVVLVDATSGFRWFGWSLTGDPVLPDYTAPAVCAGEPGTVLELRYDVPLFTSLAVGPGFESLTGDFGALVESPSGSCSESVGSWSQVGPD